MSRGNAIKCVQLYSYIVEVCDYYYTVLYMYNIIIYSVQMSCIDGNEGKVGYNLPIQVHIFNAAS